jgi:hypothetical protein
MRRHPAKSVSLLVLAMCTGIACADDHPMLDTASISVGAFANNTSADISADGGIKGSGSKVEFGRDLGQDGTRSLPYIDATWRPWDRHEFEFSYYHESHSANRTLQRDVNYDGDTFVFGANLGSKFSLDAYGVGYRYWAWIGDSAAFGLGAGLYAYHLSLDLSGTIGVEGPDGSITQTGVKSAGASTNLPDPSVGLYYRYQIVDWARFIANAGAFKANIDNIDAKLYDATAGVEFYPWKNFGVVTQYAYNRIDATVDRTKFLGKFDAKFNGLQVLAKLRF